MARPPDRTVRGLWQLRAPGQGRRERRAPRRRPRHVRAEANPSAKALTAGRTAAPALPCRLGDDVRQQLALDLDDLVFQVELALFQPLHLKLVERHLLG